MQTPSTQAGIEDVVGIVANSLDVECLGGCASPVGLLLFVVARLDISSSVSVLDAVASTLFLQDPQLVEVIGIANGGGTKHFVTLILLHQCGIVAYVDDAEHAL